MARKRKVSDFGELRDEAESRLSAQPPTPSTPTVDAERLVHELDVHRIELEMQNEELRTARRETEEGLERYTSLFDFAPIGYATLHGKGTIREINHAGARLLQRQRALLVGQPFARFVSHQWVDSWLDLLQSACYSEESVSAQLELSTPSGGDTSVRITASSIDQNDRVVLVAFEDISLQRAREKQIAEVERALRDANRRKDEFLAVLSHELRNPLAAIGSSLFLLTREGTDEGKVNRAHAVIERQVKHLTRLVDDLLDVTRIARGKIQLQRERVELVDLVARTVEDHRARFEAAGLQLDVDLDKGPYWVDADPTRLTQTVSNVLTNAEKFTPRGGNVAVQLASVGADYQLSVRDNGTGIAPEMLNRLFEPFAQAPQTMERTRGGLGLGLAMVKGLVELHGGKVLLESKGLGCGTRLTIRLPAAEAPCSVVAKVEAPSAAKRRVLVIEDNMDAADTLLDVLVLDGHEVRKAYDGPSGLDIAREFAPEVVICDIGLPHMNGYDVARAFRAESGLSETFLIALSGYAQPEDTHRALEAGFDRHMVKPPSLDVLSRVLSEAPVVKASPQHASLPMNEVRSS